VITCTTKPDRYDRYLADVFICQLNGDSLKVKDSAGSEAQRSTFNSELGASGTAVFLNNAFLENGHGVRYDGGAKEE
jgi:hypothetical protein